MSLLDFQLITQIGEGRYSSVYKVRRIPDNSIYALKKVRLQGLAAKEIQNSINQVRFLASFRHPNIIAYKEAFYDSPSISLCIVMEYADGGDLLQKIFQHKRNGTQFPQDYIWDIFIQSLRGLNALHQLKITHRDIKSANILITKNGIAKLGDFNVSIVLPKGALCETRTGTPYYASPQIWRDQPYDAKADVWSLGCVLYEFIHLKPPFRARNMEGLSKKVNLGYFGKVSRYYSDDFTPILEAMLNPDPFARLNCKDLLMHPIIREHMKKAKQIINLEGSSSLLRTIKPSRNMNYLTERLPKPNYAPLRFKTSRHVTGTLFQSKILKDNSEVLPKLQKSLDLSRSGHNHSSVEKMEKSSLGRSSMGKMERSSMEKMKKSSSLIDPELPNIRNKSKRY